MHLSKKSIALNYLSFMIVGSAGVVINIFLLSTYSTEILGRFNFFLTCVVLFSQLSVGGIQFLVLKYNAHFFKRYQEVSSIVISAVLLSLIFSIVVISSLVYLSPFIGNLFNLDYFQDDMIFILPAVVFFSLNKILLMSLNGLNRMTEYAFFNALRYVLLLLVVVFFYWLDFSERNIQVVLSVSEGLLFLILMTYLFVKIIKPTWPKKRWIKRHFSFGIRSMIGGALMEVNTRIDVLMIGAFLGYTAVGIYSFAAMIAEGFAQVFIVLKNNVDPIFGCAFQDRNNNKIAETISRIRKSYIPILILLGIMMVALYPVVFEKLLYLVEIKTICRILHIKKVYIVNGDVRFDVERTTPISLVEISGSLEAGIVFVSEFCLGLNLKRKNWKEDMLSIADHLKVILRLVNDAQ